MKFLKHILSGVTAVALACSFTACGDDDDDSNGSGNGQGGTPDVPADVPANGWDNPLTEGEPLSDEDAKIFLENTANKVINVFHPDDQRRLVDLVAAFFDNYGDYGFFESDDDDDDPYHAPSRGVSAPGVRSFFASLRSALVAGDFMALSRAAVDVVSFGDFTGIYVPDESEEIFVRTSDSDRLEIRFPIQGDTCTLAVWAEGNDSWSMDAADLTDGEIGKVIIPGTLRFNLTQGAASLAHGTVTTSWVDGRNLTAEADCTVENIRSVASFRSDNSNASSRESLYVSGDLIQTSEASVSGSGLVSAATLASMMKEESYTWTYGNESYTETWYEFDPEAAARIFRSGSATANLLNEVLVTTEIPSSSTLALLDDGYFDSYDFNGDRNAARLACENWCNTMNAGAPTSLCLGSTTPTAALKWRPRIYVDPYYSEYWYYEPEAVIEFGDGTTYAVEDYARTNFSSIRSRFASLLGAYAGMINAIG